MHNSLVSFLRLNSPDNQGRLISDIWEYPLEKLETSHDYIQWLFPLFEISAHHPEAPILTINVAKQIITDEACLSSLSRSLLTMRTFYENSSHWATPKNHNMLRITRIIKSSALLLGERISSEFYEFIMMLCDKLKFIPLNTTINFWNEAKAAKLEMYQE